MPSPVEGLGACLQKKKLISRQKLCNYEQVLVLFLYYSRKWGDYPPVLKVGGPIPPAPTPMHHHHGVARPSKSKTVSTTLRQAERSAARGHAVWRPWLSGLRSASTVRSQDWR